MKDEKREQMRKFLQGCVDRDLAQEGEDAIESWLEKVERDDGYFGIYKLTAAEKQQIKAIADEFFAAREQEEADREKRRLAEEEADEAVANHYADRIRKIVVTGMDKKWLPQPKTDAPRRKSH